MRVWHERVFADWLSSTLEQQFNDVRLYLLALDRSEILSQSWLELETYLQLMPVNLFEGERQLFLDDMPILLQALSHDYGLSCASPSFSDPRISRIIQARAGPLSKSVSLKSLGREFQLSQKYLGTLFKDFAGVSYRTFLRQTRMKKSSSLLAGTSYPIKAVGQLVGYADLANFYRDFKAVFGATGGIPPPTLEGAMSTDLGCMSF